MLFAHRCTSCQRTQLIFPSQGARVDATHEGPRMTFICWCGATQEHVMRPSEMSLSA